MLDQAGFKATLQILDVTAYTQKTLLSHPDQPAEKQSWDIALTNVQFVPYAISSTRH
jgi:hypothetical protein